MYMSFPLVDKALAGLVRVWDPEDADLEVRFDLQTDVPCKNNQ
jgi:hypothetical protein